MSSTSSRARRDKRDELPPQEKIDAQEATANAAGMAAKAKELEQRLELPGLSQTERNWLVSKIACLTKGARGWIWFAVKCAAVYAIATNTAQVTDRWNRSTVTNQLENDNTLRMPNVVSTGETRSYAHDWVDPRLGGFGFRVDPELVEAFATRPDNERFLAELDELTGGTDLAKLPAKFRKVDANTTDLTHAQQMQGAYLFDTIKLTKEQQVANLKAKKGSIWNYRPWGKAEDFVDNAQEIINAGGTIVQVLAHTKAINTFAGPIVGGVANAVLPWAARFGARTINARLRGVEEHYRADKLSREQIKQAQREIKAAENIAMIDDVANTVLQSWNFQSNRTMDTWEPRVTDTPEEAEMKVLGAKFINRLMKDNPIRSEIIKQRESGWLWKAVVVGAKPTALQNAWHKADDEIAAKFAGIWEEKDGASNPNNWIHFGCEVFRIIGRIWDGDNGFWAIPGYLIYGSVYVAVLAKVLDALQGSVAGVVIWQLFALVRSVGRVEQTIDTIKEEGRSNSGTIIAQNSQTHQMAVQTQQCMLVLAKSVHKINQKQDQILRLAPTLSFDKKKLKAALADTDNIKDLATAIDLLLESDDSDAVASFIEAAEGDIAAAAAISRSISADSEAPTEVWDSRASSLGGPKEVRSNFRFRV